MNEECFSPFDSFIPSFSSSSLSFFVFSFLLLLPSLSSSLPLSLAVFKLRIKILFLDRENLVQKGSISFTIKEQEERWGAKKGKKERVGE